MQINLRRTDLPAFGDDIGDSKAHRAMGQLEEGWRSRIPSEAPALFGWLAEQPQADVLALCAFCVATTLDGVTADERRDVLNVLSTAARLDMHEWWSPTRESYLGSVPKARILEALKEAQVAPEAETLEKLKKGDLVTLAEQRLLEPVAATRTAGFERLIVRAGAGVSAPAPAAASTSSACSTTESGVDVKNLQIEERAVLRIAELSVHPFLELRFGDLATADLF